ncbi:MAG TPA: hypothetical protein VGG39_03315 [Polyangiaceae bacterium]|jgi:hypothetical protein
MNFRVGLASLGLASAVVLGASFVQAQPAPPADDGGGEAAASSARARYNAGTKAFADRRFVEAALNFEAAAAEKASPVALYTAAMSWEQANVPERAADDYARAVAAPGLPADKIGPAHDRLAALEGVLGTVTVVGPEGTRVQLDANTELPLPVTLHGSAGVHTLSARAPGKPIERRPVVLERGKATKVDLAAEPPPPPTPDAKKEEPPPPPPPPPPPAPPEGGSLRRALGFTSIGVGGAFLLSGIVLGSEAVGAVHAYRQSPSLFGADHAAELETWTDVAFVAGAILAAGGVALVVWPSPHAAASAAPAEGVSLAPAPGGFLLRGAF